MSKVSRDIKICYRVCIFKAFSLLKNLSPDGLVWKICSSKPVSITISLLINATSFYWQTQEVLLFLFFRDFRKIELSKPYLCLFPFSLQKILKDISDLLCSQTYVPIHWSSVFMVLLLWKKIVMLAIEDTIIFSKWCISHCKVD